MRNVQVSCSNFSAKAFAKKPASISLPGFVCCLLLFQTAGGYRKVETRHDDAFIFPFYTELKKLQKKHRLEAIAIRLEAIAMIVTKQRDWC